MHRLPCILLSVVLVVAAGAGCERTQTITLPGKTDTLVVQLPPRVDTLIVPRVDTVVSVSHDTTFVPRVDTLVVPSPVVHDTTWLYAQTNPTNPFAGGDPTSGLLVLQVWSTYYLTFWHGHFMGVLMQGGYGETAYWNAYAIPTDGSIVMPLMCTKTTWLDAAACLQPLVLTVGPVPTQLTHALPSLTRVLRALALPHP